MSTLLNFSTLKQGDQINYPKKGAILLCHYSCTVIKFLLIYNLPHFPRITTFYLPNINNKTHIKSFFLLIIHN